MLFATGQCGPSRKRRADSLAEVPVAELVPAEEPARRPVLSPDPALAWRPGPRRSQPEEVGPMWRHMEPAHVVLLLIGLVIVIMVIMVAALVTGL